jgi:S-adenosylmethionine:tRNA ribosyltransferase-isomerase
MDFFEVNSFDYELPAELIAQAPVLKRDASRLLVADRRTGKLTEGHFYDLPDLLHPLDILVLNDTRVVAARLSGKKDTGGAVEVLVLGECRQDAAVSSACYCLLRSSKPPKQGGLIFFGDRYCGRIEEVLGGGLVKISFSGDVSVEHLMEEMGQVPLPRYIRRDKDDPGRELDRDRYQTVYARVPGAVAAPTAGLHFTGELLGRIKEKGILVCPITLHVGYGTFQPVRVNDIRLHRLATERYRIEKDSAEKITEARKQGRRVVAVGTTVVRALESSALRTGEVTAGEGETDLLIFPGFSFSVVDSLVTNFHLPRSSLLFLVAAFAGFDFIMEAYRYAVRQRFRFFSYGDAMLII